MHYAPPASTHAGGSLLLGSHGQCFCGGMDEQSVHDGVRPHKQRQRIAVHRQSRGGVQARYLCSSMQYANSAIPGQHPPWLVVPILLWVVR
jgi:hypothetical protein